MPAEASRAVFLSYASQDAEAALHISEALRAVGVEVWFDQNELVGGDAWDAKIRGQIGSCALFVPIISAATQARGEGYFRLEWKLAVDRSHLMAHDQPFLLPVVIDATKDSEARVPPEFRAVQWTRLPGGETPEKFCTRVKQLLSGSELEAGRPRPAQRDEGAASPANPKVGGRIPAAAWFAAAMVVAGAALYFALRPDKNAGAGTRPPTAENSVAPLSDARKLVAQARALLLKPSGGPNKYETAALLCDHALTLDPTDAEVWAIAIQVDTKTAFHTFDRSEKRIASAQSKAAKAINLSPESFEARLAQGMFQALVGGQPVAAEAEATLRALHAENPREFRVLDALGVLTREQGRGEEAVAFDDEASKLPGGAVAGLTQKAWVLRGLWRFDEAEAALDQSIALQPIAGNVGLKVFLELSWRGDLDRALAAMRKLPADELTMDVGVAAAVRLYRWRREPAEVLKFLAAVPREWLTWGIAGPKTALTGDANAELNRPAAARADWQTALALVEQRIAATPNDRNLLEWEAYLEASLGEKAQAQATWQRSREAPAPALPPLLNVEKISRVMPLDQVIDELERRVKNALDHLAPGQQSSIEFFSAADLRLNPAWDGVRSLSRFAALQARLDADPHFSPTAPKTSAAAAAPDDKSVAVLAFADLSAAHDSEYFSDGISEELINALGKVPGLKVPARTSSFYFKGKSVPMPDIAKQLGVAYVIEGSVQRAGDKVKISARLSKAADGFQVWSDSFLRDAKDVFAVEDEIAGLIAKNLSLKLGASSAATTAAVKPAAFALYVQGRQLWNRRTEEDYVEAERMFNRALELEPSFARAYVGRADARVFLAARRGEVGTWGQRNARLLADIVADIQRALELDADLAEAHASMGFLHSLRAERDAAVQEYLTAIRLNPNYATAHQWLALEYWRQGRLAEARRAALAGVKADPFSSVVAAACSIVLQSTGDFSAAMAQAERAVTLQPDSLRALGAKVSILFDLGRRDEALALARLIVGRDATTQGLGRALLVLGAAGEAGEVEQARHVSGPLASLLELQGAAALGKWDEFFARWNSSCLTLDDVWYLYVPALDPIRADTRFLGLLKEAGMLEAHTRFQASRQAHPPEKPEAKH